MSSLVVSLASAVPCDRSEEFYIAAPVQRPACARACSAAATNGPMSWLNTDSRAVFFLDVQCLVVGPVVCVFHQHKRCVL